MTQHNVLDSHYLNHFNPKKKKKKKKKKKNRRQKKHNKKKKKKKKKKKPGGILTILTILTKNQKKIKKLKGTETWNITMQIFNFEVIIVKSFILHGECFFVHKS
jgi:L-lactate permease